MRLAGFIAVLLAGVGLGWTLAVLTQDPTAPDAVVADPGDVRPAPAGPAAAELRGRVVEAGAPEAPAPAAPAVPTAAPEPVAVSTVPIDLFDEDEWETWIEEPSWTLEQEGLLAMLTLQALAGRIDGFLATVARALDAEIDPTNILERLAKFPGITGAEALDRLRAAHPSVAWPAGQVAGIYLAAGAHDRAVEVLLPALQETPEPWLATLLVQADPAKAARVLGAMTRDGTWAAGSLAEVGNALIEAGCPELALPFLQDALAAEPSNMQALLGLARVDPELARAHARELAEGSSAAEIWNQLASLEMQAGNTEAAFLAWTEALQRASTNESVFGLMRIDAERAYAATRRLAAETSDDEFMGAVAKAALKSGRPEDTFDILLRAHERDPSDGEWTRAMIELQPERAAEILGRTAAGSTNDEVIGHHASALLELGRGREAFDRYQEAYELDPGDWEWRRGMARADPERALPILESLRRAGDTSGELHGALGDALAGVGRSAEALEHYEQAVRESGAEWYARMARVDPGRAIRGLEERLRQSSGDASAWAALGEARLIAGDRAGARAAYDQARRLSDTVFTYEIHWRELQD